MGEERLSPNQSRTIEEDNFSYSSDGETFEKQMKTIKDIGKNKLKLCKS